MAAIKPTAGPATAKASAKTASKQLSSAEKAAEVVSMSSRLCAHCGALIPTKKIYVVNSISYDGAKSRTNRVFYHRDHYSNAAPSASSGRK
jgi:hypothetical protein